MSEGADVAMIAMCRWKTVQNLVRSSDQMGSDVKATTISTKDCEGDRDSVQAHDHPHKHSPVIQNTTADQLRRRRNTNESAAHRRAVTSKRAFLSGGGEVYLTNIRTNVLHGLETTKSDTSPARGEATTGTLVVARTITKATAIVLQTTAAEMQIEDV